MVLMNQKELNDLKLAKSLLENQSLAEQITNSLGVPMGILTRSIPNGWQARLSSIATKSLRLTLEVALVTLKKEGRETPQNRFHKGLATLSGGIGGFFGFSGLAVEIPVSTAIMARTIADIARSYGEQTNLPETKLACLEVFGLGKESNLDPSVKCDYYTTRHAFHGLVIGAVRDFAQRGVAAPAVSRLINAIAPRYAAALGEKIAAQIAPVVGAVGGATLNLLFTSHFQDKARGHFIVRKLERIYGREEIQNAYNMIEL